MATTGTAGYHPKSLVQSNNMPVLTAATASNNNDDEGLMTNSFNNNQKYTRQPKCMKYLARMVTSWTMTEEEFWNSQKGQSTPPEYSQQSEQERQQQGQQ